MVKWANFLINKVHYDQDRSRIESVHVMTLSGDTLIEGGEQLRTSVADALQHTRLSYKTVYQKGGVWADGEDVRAIKIGDEYFIRTDSDKIEADNLGDLPEY